MLIPLILFLLSIALVWIFDLNILIGVFLGIAFFFGTKKKIFFEKKKERWLYHIVFLLTATGMFISLIKYVSGEISAIATLWAISFACLGFREARLY